MSRTTSTKPAPASSRHDDWFYDELMTAQPDATQEYFRQQLMKHVAKKPEGDAK